ncbi:TRAP transporter small permease [Petrocella sp. FN5]|uniref:TRAP transporter small permease n=1 Tax=Petrocella sp. FN5 TaxID=3032002 RepID=UPI0023D9F15A|nr:TRAP transporter small permease subunit [Petrocella sp. FN5]MDF1618662.1 TRAP transporter small permease subunit [Petrocella sp. FN5]
MKVLIKIDESINITLQAICVSFLVILFTLLSLNVFVRFIPLFSMGWFDEIVELSFTCLSFFGAAFLWRRHEHSRIDFLSEKFMGTKKEHILELIISIIGLIFIYFMVRYSLVLISKATAWSPIFKIPRKLFYAPIPISGIIMGIYSVRDIFIIGRKIFMNPKKYAYKA